MCCCELVAEEHFYQSLGLLTKLQLQICGYAAVEQHSFKKLKTWSCGLLKKCNCGNAEMQLQRNISLKSWGYAVVEVLPSSCKIAIVDIKKVACTVDRFTGGQPLINHRAFSYYTVNASIVQCPLYPTLPRDILSYWHYFSKVFL